MAWLSGWSYRKEITITGQSGAGTNYQVDLDIGDSAGGDFHLEGHCINFPQDIEVTDNDGTTLLKFWIADITADPLELTVKVADDLGTNQTIYIYYGKSGATTNSNGSDTFIEFWDFENNTLQGFSAQTATAVTSAISKRGTYCVDLNDGSTGGGETGALSRSDFNYQSGVLEYDFYRVPNVNLECRCLMMDSTTWIFTHGILGWDSESIKHHDGAWNSYSNGAAAATGNAWEKHSIKFNEDTPYMSANVGGVDLGTGARGNTGTIDTLMFSSGASTATGRYGYIDDIRLRKFAATEPAFSSAGSEETPPVTGNPYWYYQMLKRRS